MCTVIINVSPDNAQWPVLVAANRDEKTDRSWLPPSNHWTELPQIIAGLDTSSSYLGSWLGINLSGVFSTVVNKSGSIGLSPNKQSRGRLVIEALSYTTCIEAVQAIKDNVDPSQYKGFTLLIADSQKAVIISSDEKILKFTELNPGIHMITSKGIDNTEGCSRTKRHFYDWQRAANPKPEIDDWCEWIEILSRDNILSEPRDAMVLNNIKGVSTVSSSLIAINKNPQHNRFLFAGRTSSYESFRNIKLVP